MAQTLHNNVFTKLAVSLSNSATSISLLDGSGFPTPAVGDFYFATLVSISGSTGKEDDWEIVKVTGKPATNTLTVTRGQEGTAARAWDAYTPCEIRITAGTVIMPDGTQNLSNKTITSSTLDSTVVGGTTAAAGSFTDLDATTVDATNVEVTNLKAKDGTAAGSIADSTGVVTVASAVLTTADINGGTVDGATIGQTTAALGTFTDMVADELQLTGGSGDQGKLSWNANENTVDLVVDAGETLQLGQEVEYNVRNNSGSSIAKGVPVMITGTLGSSGRITIGQMDATSVANDKKYLGITAEAIASGADGKVMYFGKVSGLNTSSYSAGDLLFLDTSSVGALTATEPSSGIKLGAAYVVHSHASAGVLMVRPSASVGLHDLHDVFVDAPGTGEIIRYNASNGLWETKTLAEAGIATTTNFTSTGIDDNATSTAITIDSSQNTTFAGTINSGDIIISEGTPVLRIQDTDGTNQYTQINNLNGTCYFGARNDTADGGIIVGGYGGNSFTEFGRWSNSGHLTQKNNLIVQGSFTSLGIDDNATSTKLTVADSAITTGSIDQLIIAHSTDGGGIRIDSTNSTNTGSLRFGDDLDNYIGALEYNHTSNAMSMYVNNATRMTVDSSGNAGIGVTDPSRRLHVKGSEQNIARFESTSTGRAVISILDGNTTDDTSVGIGAVANDLVLYSGNLSEGFRLDSSGNVGIGLGGSAASATLHVNGTFELDAVHPVGTHNLMIGTAAGEDLTSGIRNTVIGSVAGRELTTGNENTGLGYAALNATTTGFNNTAIGRSAVQANTTGRDNTGVGYLALFKNTTGDYNVALGSNALEENTTGANNIAIGYEAMEKNTTGTVMVGIGFRALEANTTGHSNTAVGYEALKLNTSGLYNTAFGRESLEDNTTGNYNSAFGTYSLYENTTGGSNTAVGYGATQSNTTASYNVGVGYQALLTNTDGANNTAIGTFAIKQNSGGSNNTAVGYASLWGIGDGGANTAVGANALFANTGGDNNTAVGNAALSANTTANNNTAIGYSALYTNTTGSNIVGVGANALLYNTTGTHHTAVGYASLQSNTTGDYNVGVGVNTLVTNTTGTLNTAVGSFALEDNTIGLRQVAIGYGALRSNTTGDWNVAVGYAALSANTTADKNVAMGYAAGNSVTTGAANTLIGHNSGVDLETGNNNVAVGENSLANGIDTIGCTALGYRAMLSNATTNYLTAVGFSALYSNTTGVSGCAFGTDALANNTTGSDNNAFGRYALGASTTGGDNNAFGRLALGANTTGSSNTAMGHATLDANTTASHNTAFGTTALTDNTTGQYNTAVGSGALANNTTASHNVGVGYGVMTSITTGADSTAVGNYALYDCANGIRNVALGYQAAHNLTASYTTALGYNAGGSITSGSGNTVIGYAADVAAATNQFSIVIGYAVTGQGGNTVTLGSSSGKIYNTFTANATWYQSSDGRYKKEIADNTDCGLGFINDLRSVTYEWKAKSEIDPSLPDYDAEETEAEYTGRMYGLVAQEVKSAMDNHGITDFAGWDEDIQGKQQISREMFVIPLIKAVQELSAKVDALEAQLSGG